MRLSNHLYGAIHSQDSCRHPNTNTTTDGSLTELDNERRCEWYDQYQHLTCYSSYIKAINIREIRQFYLLGCHSQQRSHYPRHECTLLCGYPIPPETEQPSKNSLDHWGLRKETGLLCRTSGPSLQLQNHKNAYNCGMDTWHTARAFALRRKSD